jgi:transcriptional regulator with XRE-family HTH domain
MNQLSAITGRMGKRRGKKREAVSDQIRRLIEECGLTRYQIWQATGIDQATLSRFMSGEGGLSTPALDALGELLDLELTMHGPHVE